jgi:molybdate transport system permease protein
MGKSAWQTLFHILLPNMKNAMITAGVLTFAHTIGEFGVVLMVGGNIPEETRVISVAIYNQVEGMNYEMANQYSLLLIAFSFSVLLMTYLINHRKNRLLSYD